MGVAVSKHFTQPEFINSLFYQDTSRIYYSIFYVSNGFQVLIERFLAKPKPMYFQEDFLNSLWQNFRNDASNINDQINPDDFMIYGFKALIKRRKAIFDTISKNWGISLNVERLREVKTAADLIGAIEFVGVLWLCFIIFTL